MTGEAVRDSAGGALIAEEAARANLYALIGRLFYDAPDAMLLAEICQGYDGGEEGDGPLAEPWRALRAAARSAYPVVIKQEYDTLFVGVGKAEVTPYTSHYGVGFSADQQLVRLRTQLEQWGLARCDAAFEVEDHAAGICDVMRVLVLEGRPLEEQRLFFNEFAYPGLMPFCEAVAASPSAVFYRHVARLAQAFLEVEKTAIEMQV